jgi:hypothetical protein
MRQLTGLECFFIENSGSIKAEQAAQFMQEQLLCKSIFVCFARFILT